ncbi:MAG TPA: hypothetical protein VIH26_01305 [Anaerolineales bacterium]
MIFSPLQEGRISRINDPRSGAWRRTAVVGSLLLVLVAACNLPTSQDQIGTAVAATVRALELSAPTLPPPSLTPQPPTSTPSSTPTPAATSTPTAPRIRVSENTNCRSGPAANYDFLGALLVGQVAEAAGRSTVPNYWYIHNPDRPGEFCWLWGEFATLEGDPGPLPAYTPAPSPTPSIDFILYLNSFQPCGSDSHAVFTIQNVSGATFMTGQITIVNLSNSTDLYGPLLDRHPFAPGSTDCPPGHGNVLLPGAAAYIIAPFSELPAGASARATIKLCTGDYLGGDCLTKTIDFNFP